VYSYRRWYVPKSRTARSGVVRKNLRLTQAKIDRAKRILGTTTETETIEQALDLIAFRQDVLEGIDRIAGKGGIRDVFESSEMPE
jgi:hypothetical protein